MGTIGRKMLAATGAFQMSRAGHEESLSGARAKRFTPEESFAQPLSSRWFGENEDDSDLVAVDRLPDCAFGQNAR